MAKKKIGKSIPPEYQFWRKRIEGQIRHTIHEHPEWFNLPNDEIRDRCIRSTAKRIIGEIVAGTIAGNDANGSGTTTAAIRRGVPCISASAVAGEDGGSCAAGLPEDRLAAQSKP